MTSGERTAEIRRAQQFSVYASRLIITHLERPAVFGGESSDAGTDYQPTGAAGTQWDRLGENVVLGGTQMGLYLNLGDQAFAGKESVPL